MPMASQVPVAVRVADVLGTVLEVDELPIRLRAWDGSVAGPEAAPVVTVRSPRALRRLVWAPGELGLARGYVAGELDVDGDLFTTFGALSSAGRLAPDASFTGLSVAARLSLVRTAAALRLIGPPPPPPPEEVRLRGRGRRHSRGRDAAAISHHYDVGNDFYGLVLGPSMVYSCAVWEDEATGLEAAQEAKLDLVCRKLGLRAGSRLLDVGCGWGSLALHAAQRDGADVVGATLSPRPRPRGVRPRRRRRPPPRGAAPRGPKAGGRGRPHRAGRHPRPGLPGRRGRSLRRDQLRGDGRARRAAQASRLRGGATRPPGPRRTAAQPRHRVVGRRVQVGPRQLHRPVRLPRRRTGQHG